jgi:hypothetical protein
MPENCSTLGDMLSQKVQQIQTREQTSSQHLFEAIKAAIQEAIQNLNSMPPVFASTETDEATYRLFRIYSYSDFLAWLDYENLAINSVSFLNNQMCVSLDKKENI